jgi:glutamyl-tRNA reductase
VIEEDKRMNIQLLSISHKTAPVHIRALFAFTKEAQSALMADMLNRTGISECVVLATCNRTEIYTVSEEGISSRQIMTQMQQCVLQAVQLDEALDGASLLRFYQGKQAVRHLFYVAAGLDSMVMGEDQILGQVKEAHQKAMEEGFCKTYGNTLFRMAITAAKRVKTETKLSGTSVSTATLAVKAAENAFGQLDGKNVLLIGATGKIGQIVMKNMVSDHDVQLFVTSRQAACGSSQTVSTSTLGDSHCSGRHYRTETYEAIAYEDRYHYMDAMDVIISATSSPHYTITKEKWLHHIRTQKPRILIDLAVPMDVESGIKDEKQTEVCHIDDLAVVAEQNHALRLQEADLAGKMLEEDMEQFERWMLFQDHLPLMRTVRDRMVQDAKKGDMAKAVDKLFYRIRENATPEQLEVFYALLAQSEED